MSEKQIENLILSYLKSRRIYAWKNESVGIFDQKKGVYRLKKGIHRKTGVSDIIGIYRGVPLFIEVKSEKGKLSDNQKTFLEEVRLEGALGFVARSINDVEFHLRQFDSSHLNRL